MKRSSVNQHYLVLNLIQEGNVNYWLEDLLGSILWLILPWPFPLWIRRLSSSFLVKSKAKQFWNALLPNSFLLWKASWFLYTLTKDTAMPWPVYTTLCMHSSNCQAMNRLLLPGVIERNCPLLDWQKYVVWNWNVHALPIFCIFWH